MQRHYEGWIVVEKNPGFTDTIFVEFSDRKGRNRVEMSGRGNSGCAEAVEWWDNKTHLRVQLEPMGEIGYRVYTESEEI
jgi:hypothetical protein